MVVDSPQIPGWCKSGGWVYHAASNTVFQAQRLQRDRAINQLFLRDANDGEYPLPECQEFTPATLTAPATLAGFHCPLTIRPYPQKSGWIIQAGRKRKGVILFDDAETAAQSLSAFFKGSIFTEDIDP